MKAKWLVFCLMATLLMSSAANGRAEEMERTVYQIKMSLIEETSIQEAPYLQMSMRVKVVNDSPDVWHEICFRDYMSSVYAWHYWELNTANWHSGIQRATCEGRELVVRRGSTEKLIEGISDQSVIYIQLDQPLQPGQSTVITIEYEADIPAGGMRCSYGQFDVEQAGARTYELAQFYPVMAVWEEGRWKAEPYFTSGECFYSRCADYEISLYVPEKYEVIASGEEKCRGEANGVEEWHIRAGNMRDVSIVISNELRCISGERCGVLVNSWHADNGKAPVGDNHEAQGRCMLNAAMEAIGAFTEAYGPYPYGELDVVESGYYYGGMEAPGLVRISQMYSWSMGEDDPETDRTEAEEDCCGTTAHEVAHEWFYAVVGNDQFNEAWLDESFAAYSEQVYWRHMGRSEEQIAEAMKPFVEQTPDSGDMTVNRPYDQLDSEHHADYTAAVYRRGAGFLYQMEQCMGQEQFSACMREYYRRFSFREADTEDFISVLKAHMSENAEAQALVETYLGAAS